jgi:hypothetical protein
MIVFRLSGPSSLLEIEGAVESNAFLPNHGDAELLIRVHSGGYAAQASVWVARDQLVQFRNSLVSLCQSLNGEAALASMSPDELSLKVKPVSSRGHLAVQDSLGQHVSTENSRFWHSVAFGFEFEPSQLGEAIHASWLQSPAA